MDAQPVLKLDGLCVSFGQRMVLDSLNLSLPPLGIDVLIGPIKSGKSTLFRTLADFYAGQPLNSPARHHTSGGILLAGHAWSSKHRAALASYHTSTLGMTLLQALLQVARGTAKRSPLEWRTQGLDWLEAHGLGKLVAKADMPLAQFSIRVQRAVLILAQAVAAPSLLLIDDPAHGLDDEESVWLLDWIKTLSKQVKLWIAVSDSTHAKRLADRIVLLGDRRILAHQDAQEFFLHPANQDVAQFTRDGKLSERTETRLRSLASRLVTLGGERRQNEPIEPIPDLASAGVSDSAATPVEIAPEAIPQTHREPLVTLATPSHSTPETIIENPSEQPVVAPSVSAPLPPQATPLIAQEAAASTNFSPALELQNMGVAFGQRVILDDFNLNLPTHGVDVLMGAVKSGKSTLLRTLAGVYQGHALHKVWGEMKMAGEILSAQHHPRLVQQHAKAWDESLLHILLQPLREIEQHSPAEWRELGLAKLQKYGLQEYVALANSALLQCDVRAQRSVQILAQALLHPALLLIDEPTHDLNPADSEWMVNWLKQLATQHRLCICLHNQMQAKQLADRIILIGGGRVIAHQTCADFFQRPANSLVEQFIRSGSLSLPSPDARKEELADEVAPAMLTPAAQDALQTTTTTDLPMPKQRAETAPHRLVELPMPSDEGVAQASAVGDIIFRESRAQRGFHWIVPGKIAGCPAPGSNSPIEYDLDLLARVGITKLITLTEENLDQNALQKYDISNVHLPIFDGEAPSISQTHMLLVRMQKFIAAGEVVAVHCKAGLGRTGTILAAWLIRDGGLTASDSMARLRRIEPGFIQSPEQEDFLQRYEADLTQRLV